MTKIDYSQLSDFEINKRVASKLKQITRILVPFVGNENKAVQVVKNGVWCWFNPCNTWSDAGPIIVEHRIGIIPAPENGKWRAAHRKTGDDSTPYHLTQHTNPLRAAMIVFLEMQ